jgi:hypothetical protein
LKRAEVPAERHGTRPPDLWAGNKPRYRKAEADAWLRRRAKA